MNFINIPELEWRFGYAIAIGSQREIIIENKKGLEDIALFG